MLIGIFFSSFLSAQTTPQSEIDALMALYDSTGGDFWYNNTNWGVGDPATNNWYGVVCNASGNVDQIYLDNNNLSGTLPESISDLPALRIIYMRFNAITGPLPDSLTSLSNLTTLLLDGNQISGSIPSDIGSMSSMVNLQLNGNQLSGSIPLSMGDLTSLHTLNLANNPFTPGPLPDTLSNLTNMYRLILSSCSLTGSVPDWVGSMSNLGDLRLDNNQFTGSIPDSLGNLSQLVIFYLHDNQLSGSIPTSLGNLDKVTNLLLRNNSLSGSIPSELGNMTDLVVLDLNNNQLTGSIPATLGNLSNLTNLGIYNNNLSGSLPPELGNLNKLTHMYLFQNNLTGPIPSSFGNLSSLKYLRLGRNQLSGTLPSELGNLAQLSWLYIYENNLTGSIPVSFGNLSNLTQIRAELNQLSGSIPAEIGNLSNLTSFNAWQNNFTGPIPNSFGRLTQLTHIYLQNNDLNGPLPDSIGYLPNLVLIKLHNNQLTGPIPPSYANLSGLSVLELNGNQLSGCYDPSLISLCNIPAKNLTNSGLPDFNQFCLDSTGVCAATDSSAYPTNLTASNITQTSVDLSWKSASHESGICAYNVYQDSALIGTTTDTTYGVMGLIPNTYYDFYVVAQNCAGEEPTNSNSLEVLTHSGDYSDPCILPTGTIIREYWEGISGTTVEDLIGHANYPDSPSGSEELTQLSLTPGWGDSYGDRVRGYLHPPVTGSYTFYVAGDDHADLLLSSDDDPANAVKICEINQWVAPGNITQNPSQQSVAITLQAGERYYIELLHKEGGGTSDHFEGYWVMPDSTQAIIIDGQYLSPYIPCGEVADNTPTTTSGCGTPTGNILREYWTGFAGQTVEDLINHADFPDNPDGVDTLTTFQLTPNWGNNYGDRVRAYVFPPTSGYYTFYIVSDNHGDLYLSTDATEANATKICELNSWASPGNLTARASQQSPLVYLQAGQRYYIELLHKEEGGVDDHFQAYWEIPGGSGPVIIDGQYLSMYETCSPPTASYIYTPSGLVVEFDGSGSTDPNGLPLTYDWNFGDGTTGTGKNATHVFGASGSYEVSLTVTNSQGAWGQMTQTINLSGGLVLTFSGEHPETVNVIGGGLDSLFQVVVDSALYLGEPQLPALGLQLDFNMAGGEIIPIYLDVLAEGVGGVYLLSGGNRTYLSRRFFWYKRDFELNFEHLRDIIAKWFASRCGDNTAANLPADNLNWVHQATFGDDDNGEEVLLGESVQYFDALGRSLQGQVRNIHEGKVIASQPVRDAFGRPVLNTLPAPIGNQCTFGYNSNFITNPSGQEYAYPDFDEGATLTQPLGVNANSHLGNYYSDNSVEAYNPASDFPYVRGDVTLGGVSIGAGPGDALRRGSGKEAKGTAFPVLEELDTYVIYRDTYAGTTNSPGTLKYQAIKQVSIDANGKVAVSFADKSGNAVASCLSGPEAPAPAIKTVTGETDPVY